MSDIVYNEYGYRTGTDIRLAEEGYAIEDLEVFNTPIVPAFTPVDSADYFKIPGRLRMWSAKEKYYEAIEDLDENSLTLEYSMLAFEPNPYRGSFTNLYSPLELVVTWDNSDYAESMDCAPAEYPRGFMRSPVPTIQFIVDTASINNYSSIVNNLAEEIETVIDALKLRVAISISEGSPCLTVTPTEDELTGTTAYGLALNLDLAQYLPTEGTGLVLEEIDPPDPEGCGPRYKLGTNPSCTSFVHSIIMLATPEGGIDFLCPPTGAGLFALTWNNAGLEWMPVQSCEETAPPA